MENKKTLKINCAICDARRVTEELLAAYEKVNINCAQLITTPQAQILLGKYAGKINAGMTMQLAPNVEFRTFNGYMELTPGMAPSESVMLQINGKLHIAPGCEEVLKKYVSIMLNGKLRCPKSISSRLGSVTVNGSSIVYPDEAVLLNDTAVLDRTFRFRAKQDALYYAEDRVVAVASDIDFAALAAKNIRFATKELLVSESNAEFAVPMVDEKTEITVVPDGCAYVDGRAVLDEALVKRCGTKLFIDGNLTVNRDSASLLEQIEYLRVDGNIKTVRSMRDQVAALTTFYYDKLVVVAGQVISDVASLPVTRALLEQARDGLSIEDCTNVAFDEDVEPELIREKLVSLSDCAAVLCNKEQQAVLTLIAEDVAYMGSREDATPQDEDGEAEDENEVKINCATYTF